jgi:hypothetical protein
VEEGGQLKRRDREVVGEDWTKERVEGAVLGGTNMKKIKIKIKE